MIQDSKMSYQKYFPLVKVPIRIRPEQFPQEVRELVDGTLVQN